MSELAYMTIAEASRLIRANCLGDQRVNNGAEGAERRASTRARSPSL
jgi:hypothetical protein